MIFFRRVVGDSMSPTLRDGQIIIAHTLRKFRAGQVVIAFVDGKEVVKRIDRVESNGQLYLLGDNEIHSTDSRSFGSVVDSKIEGTVFWPSIKKRK